MVSQQTQPLFAADDPTPEQLAQELFEPGIDPARMQRACRLALEAGALEKHRPRGVEVARILKPLGVDQATLETALLSDPALRDSLPAETIEQEFGPQLAAMVVGVHRLNTFEGLNEIATDRPGEADKLRRMLLAITDDPRVVLIKLAFRLARLRVLKHADYDTRRAIARETLDIFAPIANWLGIGQLKWELEDLAFRNLDPQTYKRVAGLLEERRGDREGYIRDFVAELQGALREEGLGGEVVGRPKHIFSIWRKMQRKQVEFDQLFDVRAVRVLVGSVADCYGTLGVVHTRWQPLPKEFDDYIAHPKENGYQSLHTAVIGPDGKTVEVQIRTREMHAAAEQGVASHWRYKAGNKLDEALERNISQVRQLIERTGREDGELLYNASDELFGDRVYVFTPTGQIVDLPRAATPVDFAYAIHTEVGHRCRGAKVNGRIVPLTYQLQSGERVEILTTREGGPSRDWMNQQLGYLRSTHARSKVRAWYNQQDYEQNVQDGRALVEKACHRLALRDMPLERLVERSGRKDLDGLLAEVGRGVVTSAQISAWLQELQTPEIEKLVTPQRRRGSGKRTGDTVSVRGVGNLMTKIARCCRPVPGDEIVGFITLGTGVSVHRRDCPNMLALDEEGRRRLIEVEWGEADTTSFPVDIKILAFDRTGLLRDISALLANEKINLLRADTQTDPDDQMASLRLTIEIDDLAQLAKLLDHIAAVPNVLEVSRAR